MKLPRNELGLVVATIVVVGLVLLFDPQRNYLSNPQTSIEDIVRQTSLLGIFALGAAVVIIAGGIDLSSGSMIAFSGTVCASIMVWLAPQEMQANQPIGLGVMAAAITGTLIAGLLVGSLHAWLITAVGLPPFIATLSTLVGLRSLGQAIVEHVTNDIYGGRRTQINISDEQFRYLATSVWIPAVLFLLLALMVWLMMSRTVVGRHLYSLGGNENATRLSGIRTDRLKWLAYCLGTVLSSIAGILYIGSLSVANPQTLGRGFELNAIAAAVVGGCSLQGGVGTILGTMLGCVFLRVVIDGVAKVIKTGSYIYEGLVVGIVVVVAVAFNQLRTGSSSGRRMLPGPLGAVMVVTLALLTGVLSTLFGGKQAGAIAGGVTLVLLAVIKVIESRKASR